MTETALYAHLEHLVEAQLVTALPGDRFAFRHVLTREAAYTTLLRRERRLCHLAVVQALEHLYAASLDEHLGELAFHAYEAEAWEAATRYAQRAGEQAQAMFAPREALGHFTRAIEAVQRLGQPVPAALLTARARCHEVLGAFDEARADYEAALAAARASGDGLTEWNSLLDLGQLWAGRDYTRTREYFHLALELARASGDQARLGHSLNRLGNLAFNTQRMDAALPYHREALEIFQALNDLRGLAETHDLLGLVYSASGDGVRGPAHLQSAIDLFRELGDRRGLASSMAILAERGPVLYTDLSVSSVAASEGLADIEQALRQACDIGWRAGEAYALGLRACYFVVLGDYTRALDDVTAALAIAEDIGHLQWLAFGTTVSGHLYMDLHALPEARAQLERAWRLACETNSALWQSAAAYSLAELAVREGNPAAGRAALDGLYEQLGDVDRGWHHLLAYGEARVALALGQAEAAEQKLQALIAGTPNLGPGVVVPRVWHLRAEARAAQGRLDEAAADLEAALAGARRLEMHNLTWRLHAALARVYRAQRRYAKARPHVEAGRAQAARLAETVPAGPLREGFERHAASLFPKPRRG